MEVSLFTGRKNRPAGCAHEGFPLYEVENGDRYNINIAPKNIPVEEYLRLQGRFNHLTEDQIRGIQETVDREWERLLKKALD